MERQSWTLSQFAAIHGLTYHAVRKAIRDGKIKAGRLWEGGNLRIFHDDVLKQIAEQIKKEQR